MAYDYDALAPPLMDEEDDPRQVRLDELYDSYVYEQGGSCLICEEIRTRVGWAAFPGWACELADCIHCENCGLCGKSGKVCRVCDLCVEHEDTALNSPCESVVWSRVRRREVPYFKHQLWDPATGRWASS